MKKETFKLIWNNETIEAGIEKHLDAIYLADEYRLAFNDPNVEIVKE
jgi:hypothetical protein